MFKKSAGRRRYAPKKRKLSDLGKDDCKAMKEINRTGRHTRQVYSTLFTYRVEVY